MRDKSKIIDEVMGIAKNQHLDSEILKTSILEDKFKKFSRIGINYKYKLKLKDMKLLAEVEDKVQMGEELSLEELRFLYEVDLKIQGFVSDEDPRISEIISQRDKNKDYARIFKVEESEVTSNKEDVLSGKAKVFVGDLNLEPNDDLSRVRLEAIGGDAYFFGLISAKGLESLAYIGGDAYFFGLTSAKGLESLAYIGGDAYFFDLTSAKGLVAYIGGKAHFFYNFKNKGKKTLKIVDNYDGYYNDL